VVFYLSLIVLKEVAYKLTNSKMSDYLTQLKSLQKSSFTNRVISLVAAALLGATSGSALSLAYKNKSPYSLRVFYWFMMVLAVCLFGYAIYPLVKAIATKA
jgi:FtsH-binding integral membrane protein